MWATDPPDFPDNAGLLSGSGRLMAKTVTKRVANGVPNEIGDGERGRVP